MPLHADMTHASKCKTFKGCHVGSADLIFTRGKDEFQEGIFEALNVKRVGLLYACEMQMPPSVGELEQ